MDKDIVQVFDNEQFGELRVVEIDGEPWFVAKDVTDALGFSNAHDAVKYLDDDEKGRINNPTPGGKQEMLIINEPGLYSLVLKSRKPEAKAFKRWVTHEVIPSIRRSGGYIASREGDTEDDILSRALIIANERIEKMRATSGKLAEENAKLSARNKKLETKAGFYDEVMEADGLMPVRNAAKLLKSYDKAMGMKRLFSALRADGLMEQNTRYATAEAIERGYMRERSYTYLDSDGNKKLCHYGCLTPKGLAWCVEHYCVADPQEELEAKEGEAA